MIMVYVREVEKQRRDFSSYVTDVSGTSAGSFHLFSDVGVPKVLGNSLLVFYAVLLCFCSRVSCSEVF